MNENISSKDKFSVASTINEKDCCKDDNHFEQFKNPKCRTQNKIEEIISYIDKYIKPIIIKLKDKFLPIEEIGSKGNKDNFAFINLLIKLDENAINNFFEILSFVENKLTSNDYNDYDLFIKYFINYFIKEYEEDHLWRIINNIFMVKIYHDLRSGKRGNTLSFINENNYFCKCILENILDNFEIEHLSGLYDYINFEDNFTIKDEESNNDNDISYINDCVRNDSFVGGENNPYSILETKNCYSFDTNLNEKDEKKKIIRISDKLNNIWNKFIEDDCKNEQNLRIIYNIFDKLDDNKDFRFRKKFFKKLFEKISEKKELLSDPIFISSILKLILNNGEEKYIDIKTQYD